MSRLRPRKIYTLAILHSESDILLGWKKRGFGEGKWNGFGGKVEEGESVAEAAKREVKDECGLEPQDLMKCGALEFEFMGRPEIMHVHVFKSISWTGVLQESEEMQPMWFTLDNIPWANMWPDDKHWLPLVLKGEYFHGYFLYDTNEQIIEQRLNTLEYPLK